MALKQEDQQKLNTQGLLNISAKDYYFNKLRPVLVYFNQTYHTDRELNRTITEVLNRADSAAANNKHNNLVESYENLLGCITAKNYMISGPMRYGSTEEKNAVSDLIEKFADFSAILKYEKEEEPEEKQIKNRLNYQPPSGGNMGYNLDDLSNRGPRENKERIPNRESKRLPY